MKLTDLKGKVGEWLRGGRDGDVAISSRIRLARNVEDYPFVSRASDEQIAGVEELLRSKITTCDFGHPLDYHRLDGMESLFLELLTERHLISRDLAEGDRVRAVAFDSQERTSLMVNEEDHLRIQVVGGGFCLDEVWQETNHIDDILAAEIHFAFSSKYGFLTACPTNVGTGMRASVMLHLPALVMRHETDKVTARAAELSLALRGFYGEGTYASGDLYQVSNQITLGLSEEEITEKVSSAAEQIIKLERAARLNLLNEHGTEVRNRMERAFEMLTGATSVSSEEALHLLSQIRMGVETNIIKGTRIEALNELFLLTLPAHLQTIQGRRIDNLERNQLRAAYLRERLTSGGSNV